MTGAARRRPDIDAAAAPIEDRRWLREAEPGARCSTITTAVETA